VSAIGEAHREQVRRVLTTWIERSRNSASRHSRRTGAPPRWEVPDVDAHHRRRYHPGRDRSFPFGDRESESALLRSGIVRQPTPVRGSCHLRRADRHSGRP
jgi:hypothetical protein